MRTTMSTRPLLRGARAAALVAILALGTGACEHTGSLTPRSPQPDASMERREVDALLTAMQTETRTQGGPADAAREQLIAALFAAAREPAPQASTMDRPATAVPAHVEKALAGLLAARGDSAAIAKTLRDFADPDRRTP